jgi:hypothetical protein
VTRVTFEPALGQVVRVKQEDSQLFGDVGEIEILLHGSIGVRIVQDESAWRGQLVYFNASQLELVFKERGQ